MSVQSFMAINPIFVDIFQSGFPFLLYIVLSHDTAVYQNTVPLTQMNRDGSAQKEKWQFINKNSVVMKYKYMRALNTNNMSEILIKGISR